MHELGLYIKRGSRNEFARRSWLILLSSLLLLSLPQLLQNQCMRTLSFPCYSPSLAKAFKVGAADTKWECRPLIYYWSTAKGTESMSSSPSLHLCESKGILLTTRGHMKKSCDLYFLLANAINKKKQQHLLVFPSH